MAAAASKISFLFLFFIVSSPLSTPAAQELLETSPPPVDLKDTTKRLHRILVQFSSTLAQIIDTAADDDVNKKEVETVRELLSLISIIESLLNQSMISGAGGFGSEMGATLSSLRSVISSMDALSLTFTNSDDFSNLLKRLVSLISSLEFDSS